MATSDGENIPVSQLPIRSLYEYCFDIENKRWITWKSLVTPLALPDDGRNLMPAARHAPLQYQPSFLEYSANI
jgi:hypothetical protein